MTAFID